MERKEVNTNMIPNTNTTLLNLGAAPSNAPGSRANDHARSSSGDGAFGEALAGAQTVLDTSSNNRTENPGRGNAYAYGHDKVRGDDHDNSDGSRTADKASSRKDVETTDDGSTASAGPAAAGDDAAEVTNNSPGTNDDAAGEATDTTTPVDGSTSPVAPATTSPATDALVAAGTGTAAAFVTEVIATTTAASAAAEATVVIATTTAASAAAEATVVVGAATTATSATATSAAATAATEAGTPEAPIAATSTMVTTDAGQGEEVSVPGDGSTGAKSLTTASPTTATGPTPAQTVSQQAGTVEPDAPSTGGAAVVNPTTQVTETTSTTGQAGAATQATSATGQTSTADEAAGSGEAPTVQVAVANATKTTTQADTSDAQATETSSGDDGVSTQTTQAGNSTQADTGSESPEDGNIRLHGLAQAAKAAGEHGAEGRATAVAAQADHATASTQAGNQAAAAATAPAAANAAAQAQSSEAAAAAKATPTTATPPATTTADTSATQPGNMAAPARTPDSGAQFGRVTDVSHFQLNQERIDNIAAQLATRMRLSQAAGGAQVHLSMRPRELGDVHVQLTVREGAVAATVLVDKADTGRILQSNLEDLRRSLESQGLNITHFDVDVRDGEARNAYAQQAGSGNGRGSDAGQGNPTSDDVAAVPGLSGDRMVTQEDLHDGSVSVLA